MNPAPLDLTHYRGDDFDLSITLKAGGVPLDLTGRTIVATVRDGRDMESALLATFTIVNADTLTDDGVVQLHLDGAVTLDFPIIAAWDLKVLTGTSPKTYVSGQFETDPDVRPEVP